MVEHESAHSPEHCNHLTRRAALHGAAVCGALALPAGAAVAAVEPNPEIPALVNAYHRASRSFHRAWNRAHRIEVAVWRDAPDLIREHPLFADSVFSLINHHDVLDDIQVDDDKFYSRRGLAAHIVEHREEIRAVLERHGWVKAHLSMEKAEARMGTAFAAAMAAPVASPADLLAKLQVRGADMWKADFQDVDAGGGDEDAQLLVAVYRSVEAMAGRASS